MVDLVKPVRGAVIDAFKAHPEYLTTKGKNNAVDSVTKRVIGVLKSLDVKASGGR